MKHVCLTCGYVWDCEDYDCEYSDVQDANCENHSPEALKIEFDLKEKYHL